MQMLNKRMLLPPRPRPPVVFSKLVAVRLHRELIGTATRVCFTQGLSGAAAF